LSRIEEEEDLTVQACADILYEVHMEGECHTLYSNIFDPVNLNLYLNYGEKYVKQKRINLPEVLCQRRSFKQFNISYMTGVDGTLLVKLVRIDEDFYTPPVPTSFHILSLLAVGVVMTTSGAYYYKRRLK
jgi:hypothetical protein